MELKLQNRYKYAGDIFNALVEKAGFPVDVATEFCNGIKDAKVVEQEHGRRIPVWAAPVVHSKWEICCDGYYPYCKNCGEEPKSGKMTKFCPNCGAKMDGGEE